MHETLSAGYIDNTDMGRGIGYPKLVSSTNMKYLAFQDISYFNSLCDLCRAENAGTTETLPSLDDYIAEITAFLRRDKPQPVEIL